MTEMSDPQRSFEQWEAELTSGARWRRWSAAAHFFLHPPPERRRQVWLSRAGTVGLLSVAATLAFFIAKSSEVSPEETALRKAYGSEAVLKSFGLCQPELDAQWQYEAFVLQHPSSFNTPYRQEQRGRLSFIKSSAGLAGARSVPCTPPAGSATVIETVEAGEKFSFTPERLTVFNAAVACDVVAGSIPPHSKNADLQAEFVRLNQELATATAQAC